MTLATKPEPQDVAIPSHAATNAQAAEAAAVLTKSRRLTAWQLHRWPDDKRITRRQVRVHLPRSYFSKEGIDLRLAPAGTDLNLFVYRPDPRVVGFSLDYNGDVHICWYDRYLNEQWVDDGKWTQLDVEQSELGGWMERLP
ncbi:hypothetical protein K488DRAFT_75489 [Vararia minispora EC-137]|uniref:Uncharacterized protein n=1 Tax=Vararia minispora EC-137 TaxID=1314806 RepID=A0ACB8R046_9AGAM|nr:hypothetical protein K488DRAFT_75489 [Vararia minispora EC-137]